MNFNHYGLLTLIALLLILNFVALPVQVTVGIVFLAAVLAAFLVTYWIFEGVEI